MEWLQSLASHVAGMGLPAFVVIYLVLCVLPAPSWPLTLAAGAIFGFAEGFAIVGTLSYAGSLIAFEIARHALRGKVKEAARKHRRVKALEEALRDGGWKAVTLLQLSPVMPFGLQNYFLGASKVRMRDFLAGTALGIGPKSVVAVLAGASSRRLAELQGAARWTILAVGIAATIVLTRWMTRLAQRHLRGATSGR